MITDANGMPVLQPLVDDASTATFNAAFAQIGTTLDNRWPIKTYKWANNAARTAQTGMSAGDLGYQIDTDTTYQYTGSVWVVRLEDTGWVSITSFATGVTPNAGTPPRARLKNGVVFLEGRVNISTNLTGGGPLCTLPTGFRPPRDYYTIPGFSNSTAITGRLIIRATGVVEVTSLSVAASYLHLDNYTYIVD